MTIEYALTRVEIVGGYFRSLLNSPRYLATICAYALAFGTVVLVSTGAFSRPLRPWDAAIVAIAALGFIFLMPIMLFIRGKTSKRSLTIFPDGISTEIGSLKAQLAWRKVKLIVETDSYILVSGASGNAFFIPARAFSHSEEKTEFATKAKNWAAKV